MAHLYGESPEETQHRLEFPGPAPKYLLCTFAGTYYQVDMDPQNLRLLMWKGRGIMACKAKTRQYIDTLWEEIPVREIRLPARLCEPMVFITKTRCETTTAHIFGRQVITALDKKLNPKEATLSEQYVEEVSDVRD